MKLPPFRILAARSVEEASEMLGRSGDDAVVYAGGTELLLVLKLGFAEYAELIDIKKIAALRRIEVMDGELEIGATVTHREIERSAIVSDHWPALAVMERSVANIRVRSVGTLAGNLCFADPHSDPATFLLAAGASVTCSNGREPRRIPMDEFFLGPYETARRPSELLTAIRVPALPRGAAMVHKKLSFKERPAVTVTCLVHVEDRHIRTVRVAVGSVGPTPVRATRAEEALMGVSASDLADDTLRVAAAAAAEGSGAVQDANGSAEYKQHLVAVLVRRCVREAATAALRSEDAA